MISREPTIDGKMYDAQAEMSSRAKPGENFVRWGLGRIVGNKRMEEWCTSHWKRQDSLANRDR
jgi:hypothetical protein